MPTYVKGYGPSTADLMVVGEAPGKAEEEQGIAFVGLSGNILRGVARDAGFSLEQAYLTNVVKIRPPENKIRRLRELGKSVEDFLPQLWEEIKEINPKCILAVGETALNALVGVKGITKYRGSILANCRSVLPKVVPTLHPASLLHQTTSGGPKSWKELSYIRFDVARAVEQSKFREIVRPERTLIVAHNSLDLVRFLDRHVKESIVSIDVETYKTMPQCIAFAFSKHEALSVPLLNTLSATNPEGIPPFDQAYVWKLVAEFLHDTRIKVIGQNLKFDERICEKAGLKMHDIYFDTMLGWKTAYPEFPGALEFIASVVTKEPYWKDEGSEYNPKKHKLSRLLLYNAKDAAVTFECYEQIRDILVEMGTFDWFMEHVMPLHRLYYELEDVGLLVDVAARKGLRVKYDGMVEVRHAELVELVEHDINPNSPKQVGDLLYGELKCPVRKNVAEDTLKSLINNILKDEKRKRILTLILEERKVRKTVSTYLKAKPSADGRIHTQYRIVGTESGRTSTSVLEPPVSVEKEGIALQTMTKHDSVGVDAGGADLRSMFIADPGYVQLEADLSQAEDRVVSVLAKDWDAFKIYNKTKFKYNKHGLKDDRHVLTAVAVCSLSFEDITHQDRQMGKKARHSGNYNIGKHQHMLNLARYGNIFISEWRAGQQLKKFHADNENIRGVYHAEIQEALEVNDCVLVSPHGRRRTFFNKWGPEMFKEAYSFIPQATVSDQLKFAMLRIRKRLPRNLFKFIQESHDSFLALVHKSILSLAATIVREELTTPINFTNCTLLRDYNLVIPCEIKVGNRWIDKSDEFPDGLEVYV